MVMRMGYVDDRAIQGLCIELIIVQATFNHLEV